MRMRCELTLAVILSSFAALAAERFVIPTLGATEFPDTEVSTNVAFAAGDADDLLTVRLTLNAAETNNAFVLSFGTDADGDGRLAPDERCFSLGWDCGAWFVREEVTGWVRTLPSAAECRTLGVRLRLDSDGTPRTLELEDGAGRSLVLGRSDLPRGLFRREWNCLNVTGRGIPPCGATGFVRTGGIGFILRIR